MTMPRYNAIMRYQRKHPPSHIILAVAFDVKSKPETIEVPPEEEKPEFEE